MKKNEWIALLKLRNNLLIRLYDEVLTKIGDMHNKWKEYQEIAVILWCSNSYLSNLINAKPCVMDWVTIKNLSNYLNKIW